MFSSLYGNKNLVPYFTNEVLIRIFTPKKIAKSEKCIMRFTIHTLNVNSDIYIKITPVGRVTCMGGGGVGRGSHPTFRSKHLKMKRSFGKKKVTKKDLGHAWCEI
jgi:hypothetical protein